MIFNAEVIKMFYVYEWYIVETGEVIYIGKGTKNRYKVRKHNKFFNEMITRFNCKSRIVKEFKSEKDAFSYEFKKIREYKKIGQCVCNIYDGGFGGTAECWDEEKREWYSKHNAMKSELQRKRMSKNNPMKNKDICEKVNSKKRIPVLIGDTEYPSIKSVCEAFNVSSATVNGWCIRGKAANGLECHYAKEKPEIYFHKNDGQKRKVFYKGKMYESSTEMARILKISQTTASRWARQGRDSQGNLCRYEDDTRENFLNVNQKSVPIIVNGTKYPSKEAASRALNITPYTLTQYLKGNRKDTKYICKYDNQQPSQTKSDNSSLEGSTTNR